MNAPRPLSLLQITLIVHELEEAVLSFEDALGLRVAFRDPGVAIFGLENAVLPMGTTFVELLSPLRADSAGARHLARRGDGGYMVILQAEELDPWRTPLEAQRVRIAWEGSTEDEEHGLAWTGLHLHPADTGGMMISLDRPDPPDSWAGAGPHWRDFVVQTVTRGLVGIRLADPDPERLASRWSEVLGRPVREGRRIDLDRGRIGFGPLPASGRPGLECVELEASRRDRVGETFELAGVRFELV